MFGMFAPAMMEIEWIGDCPPEFKWKPQDPKSKYGLKRIRVRIKRVFKLGDKEYNKQFKVNEFKLRYIEEQKDSNFIYRMWLKKYIKKLIEFMKNSEGNIFEDKVRTNQILIEYLNDYLKYLR